MHVPIPCEPLHEVLQYSGGHGIQDMRCRSEQNYRITGMSVFISFVTTALSIVIFWEKHLYLSLKKHENSECGKESVAAFS